MARMDPGPGESLDERPEERLRGRATPLGWAEVATAGAPALAGLAVAAAGGAGPVPAIALGLVGSAAAAAALWHRKANPAADRREDAASADLDPDRWRADDAPAGMPRGLEAAATTILAAVPDPVILLDGEGGVRAANARARAAFPGLRTGAPLVSAIRHPAFVEALERLAAGEAPVEAEFEERVPVGRVFSVHAAPLEASRVSAVDDAVRAPLVVVTLRDLTAARALDRTRSDFVANASHELRTPLASLLGFIETLQGPARADEAARGRFLAIMREQAERMARLIEDLLSLSRAEMRAHLVPEDEVELGAVVNEVVAALQPVASGAGVEIAWTPPETDTPVRGERDDLVRLVSNLVENAIRHGGSGGRVEIGLERGPPSRRESGGRNGARPGHAILSVRDHGPGIAREHLPRLTERFYRVDVGASRAKGGTGLGLAIVKHILARHGGRLAIESEEGSGATFRVTLPGAAASPGRGG